MIEQTRKIGDLLSAQMVDFHRASHISLYIAPNLTSFNKLHHQNFFVLHRIMKTATDGAYFIHWE